MHNRSPPQRRAWQRSRCRVARKQSNLEGILVVDKPGLPAGVAPAQAGALPTSHDTVQRVRRWSGQRRIGHTGTLDPMASGVLVLCLGRATRLVEYYQGHDKRYTAQITLGVETDTYDALGKVVETGPVSPPASAQIEAALEKFRGPIAQKPPVYSALKQGGESLHYKARRGEEVEVAPRPVVIHALRLLAYHPPQIYLAVHCSAGAYIRSLAHDLGRALGSCAHLSYLRREAAGPFSAADAHALDAVEEAARRDALGALLLPPGDRLDLPVVMLDAEESERLGYGQKRWLPAPGDARTPGDVVQGLDRQGQLLGILRVLAFSSDGNSSLFKADKWLAS